LRIFDAFMVDDELDLLKIRVEELKGVENLTHVALQGTRTFRGDPRELISIDLPRFDLHTICLPRFDDPWKAEAYQRDHLLIVLEGYSPAADDLVISGEADEIPRARQIPTVLMGTEGGPVRLDMRSHRYSPRWVLPHQLTGCRGFRWKDRAGGGRLTPMWRAVPNAGWDLGWFGGPEAFHRQLRSFSHTEYDTPVYHGQVNFMIDNGICLDGTRLAPWPEGLDMPAGLT
jgi:hypothetical protein